MNPKHADRWCGPAGQAAAHAMGSLEAQGCSMGIRAWHGHGNGTGMACRRRGASMAWHGLAWLGMARPADQLAMPPKQLDSALPARRAVSGCAPDGPPASPSQPAAMPRPNSLGWVQRVPPARHVHQLRGPVPALHRAAVACAWKAAANAHRAAKHAPGACCPAARQPEAGGQAQRYRPAALQHPMLPAAAPAHPPRELTLPQRWDPPTPGKPRRAARSPPVAAPRPPRPISDAPAPPPPPRPRPAAAPAGPRAAPGGSRQGAGRGRDVTAGAEGRAFTAAGCTPGGAPAQQAGASWHSSTAQA